MRIGVFICHCGSNIGGMVDVEQVAFQIAKMPGVVTAITLPHTCSESGQRIIQQAIREKGLNRVVVAACSPRVHEETFKHTLAAAGLNPYLLEIANIREQCSWIHDEREAATLKALRLVAMAVAKAQRLESLESARVPVGKKTLVIGGGIAGIQAALDIAEGGREVILVEREPTIGGNMAKLDKVFPTLDCSACILAPKMVDVHHNSNITLYTYTEVEGVSGYVGNFKVKLRRKPRYVDEATCTGCQECSKVCPVNLASKFNEGLCDRKAIYIPFPQAVPQVATIDKRGISPCRASCPIGSRAQGYISLIAQGKFNEALRVIAEDNPFPSICGRVCQHPCEESCKRNDLDQPLAVAALKRAAVDYATTVPGKPEPSLARPERVAVVGSGPAGLTAAWELAKQGYGVTVFEAQSVLGGMMRLGIPEHRLPRKVLDKEIQAIIEQGIEVKTNTRLGKDITIEALFAKGYKAIFLAIGAQASRRLGIAGEGFKGVFPALDFLREVNLNKRVKLGDRVAVIGGGNTAVDSARVAWRLGAKAVTILYRRSRKEMPAVDSEIEEAEREGISIKYLTAPSKILGESGKVIGIECVKMELGAADESGRRRPIPVEGSEFTLEADTILPAVGQIIELPSSQDNTLELERGVLQVDEVTLATKVSGVFAGGDLTSGPATVTDAIWAGRCAAVSIERYLKGESLTEGRDKESLPALSREEIKISDGEPCRERQEMPTLPVEERRGNFREVELGLSREAAIAEAQRCLACAGCGECGECLKACEAECIEHRAKEELIELEVGAIVAATGYDLFDWKVYGEYGYGRYPDVVSGLQFERLLSAGGPTGGHILRPSDGKEPELIVIIACVGSRDPARGRPYCSSVCCMYTAKYAMLIKEHQPQSRVLIFYMDVRAAGKMYEEFVLRAKEQYGAQYIRGRVSEIFPKEGKLIIRGVDTLLGAPVEVAADLVVLAVGIDSAFGARELAQKLNIAHDEYGFFTESHPKLRPVESSSPGIFIAGACQAPKDVPLSVAQASSVAGKVLGLISHDELEISPLIAQIDTRRCVGCMRCVQVCPFQAISEQTLRDGRKVVEVQPALCQGCGVCSATCLPGAIFCKGFTDDQLIGEIEALCQR